MAAAPPPTLREVQAEVLGIDLDENSPIFARLNQYIHHVNRIAALLQRVGDNYDHRRWALASKSAKRDPVYRSIRSNALRILEIMVQLFQMNSARRLIHAADPRKSAWLERETDDGPQERTDALDVLHDYLPALQSHDLETALGVGRRVRQTSRRTFADPIYELHRSWLYKEMLKIRRGTITLWIWLQQLAQCGDESERADMVYYLTGCWVDSLIHCVGEQTDMNAFVPRFAQYMSRGLTAWPALLQTIRSLPPGPEGMFDIDEYIYYNNLDIEPVLNGVLYKAIVEPALIQCSRTLRGMRQVQKRYQDWFWRPAEENPDGTFDMRTAGRGVMSRLEEYRSAHS